MLVQRPRRALAARRARAARHSRAMKQSNQRSSANRQVPLDHLRPGGRRANDPDTAPPRAGGGPSAEPADDYTPGGGDADATSGKATRSPADVATQPHLEGSEQGPQ